MSSGDTLQESYCWFKLLFGVLLPVLTLLAYLLITYLASPFLTLYPTCPPHLHPPNHPQP